MTKLKSFNQVEKELSRLYEEKGEANRACLFNLVVWAPTTERGKYLSLLVDKVAEKFPCRLIFITLTDTAKAKLEIDVSVNLKPNVACDLIEITIPHAEKEKVPFLIFPHLLPDLPMYLLWGQDPTIKNELYNILLPHCSRVIFDSVCLKSLSSFAKDILPKDKTNLRDVNWTLLSGWRSIISRTLDTVEKANTLKKATSIEIIHKGESTLQSDLLMGWFISKLNLSPKIFKSTSKEGDGYEGDILSLTLTTPEVEFTFIRNKHKVAIHVSNDTTCELPQLLPLTHIQRGFSFWRELLFEPFSIDYVKTLQAIQKIHHG